MKGAAFADYFIASILVKLSGRDFLIVLVVLAIAVWAGVCFGNEGGSQCSERQSSSAR